MHVCRERDDDECSSGGGGGRKTVGGRQEKNDVMWRTHMHIHSTE